MRIHAKDSYLDVGVNNIISKLIKAGYSHYQIVEVDNTENVDLQEVVDILKRNKYSRINFLQTDKSNLVIGLR